jgi:hypothetical protein
VVNGVVLVELSTLARTPKKKKKKNLKKKVAQILRTLRAPSRSSVNVIRFEKECIKNIFGRGGSCHPLYDHVGSRLLANAMIQRVHNIECHR